MNNACPCCRAQLLEEPEEEEEDSEYDDDEDEDDEDIYEGELLTMEELNENVGIIHEKLLTSNISSNDLMKVVLLCMHQYVSGEYHDEFNELADKITDSLDTIIPDIHSKLREEKEQQMFAKEDNIDKILNTYNGLELINHFYM